MEFHSVLPSFVFKNHRKEPSEPDRDEEDSTNDEMELDTFDDHPWLTDITGVVTDPATSKEIARCFGQVIDRPRIRDDFHRKMDEPSRELQGLGWILFDKKGYLKKDHYEKEVTKGSGVFGNELSKGKICNIKTVTVDKSWRRQGIATKLIQGVIKLAEEDGCTLTFAWPTKLNTEDLEAEAEKFDREEEKLDIWDREHSIALKLFRKNGFRRVGVSNYFCRPSSQDHKAYQLPEEDDADILEPLDLTPKEALNAKFPIHFAIMNNDDEAKVLSYISSLDETVGFDLKDDYKSSPLHYAAYRKYPSVVKFLLTKDGVHFDLHKKNLHGHTPLELMEKKSEEEMEFAEGMLGEWKGNDAKWIECRLLLKTAMGDIDSNDFSALRDAAKKSRYSCKCGTCVDGVMSKRMCYELLCQAEIQNDMFRDTLEDVWQHVKGGSMKDMLVHFDELSYIPLQLQESTVHHKTFKVGYGKVFEYIAGCLRENKLPTIAEINRYWQANPDWPPNTKTFLHKGGKFEYALDCILSSAESQNFIHGDREHWRIFKDEIKQIPKCETNDDNFKLMRIALLSPEAGASVVAHGPYYPPNYWSLPAQTPEQVAENEKLRQELDEMMERPTPEPTGKRRAPFAFSDEEP